MANRDVTGDLIKGTLAGAVATWVMGRTTTWLYEREPERVRNREEQALKALDRAA